MHVFQAVVFWIVSSMALMQNILLATGGLYQEKIEREIIMTDAQKATITKGKHIYSYTLPNGLTVIVREQHTIPKVSIQMWYNVGSKDEQIGHKGIAHFIEHLIFKGTSGEVGKSLNLSESDINMIAHKLSGYINAFTSSKFDLRKNSE